MDNLTSSLAAETEALRETYAALNRNDIEATVKASDPRIAWIEPAEYPGGGTYHGHAAVKAHLSRARGTWAEGSCEPERFLVAGDKVIVFIRYFRLCQRRHRQLPHLRIPGYRDQHQRPLHGRILESCFMPGDGVAWRPESDDVLRVDQLFGGIGAGTGFCTGFTLRK
jgi:ketosteroid isomerase-like protein